MEPSFLDLSVRQLLDDVASPRPSPGGGSVLALTLAMAAGVITMAARATGEGWEEAAGTAAQAEALRARAAALADHDAEVYERALSVVDATEAIDPDKRDWEIGKAFAAAAEPPLRLAELALDVARLAAETAARADPKLRPDAVAAAVLASAVAKGAAELVAVNLTASPDDDRVLRARELAEDADRAARFAALD